MFPDYIRAISLRSQDMSKSPAYDRFVASMKLGYVEWHDGISYDIDALDKVHGDERQELEALLIANKDSDWRYSEALGRIGSPKAWDALFASTKGPNREVRFRAAEILHAAGRFPDLSDLVVESIHNSKIGDGFAEGMRWAAQYKTPVVVTALLEELLNPSNKNAVHFAAMLYFLFGKAKEPFDWQYRPFFLKFLTNDPQERRALFDELCSAIGIDAKAYLEKLGT